MMRRYGVVALGVVLVAVLGCQMVAGITQPAGTGARVSVWGEVPRQCACHGEPTSAVTTELQNDNLPVDFKMEDAREGYQVFSVTFDPAQVSSDHVRQTLVDAGAQIIPPPTGQR